MVGYRLENNNGQKITNSNRKLSNTNLGYGLNFNGTSNYVTHSQLNLGTSNSFFIAFKQTAYNINNFSIILNTLIGSRYMLGLTPTNLFINYSGVSGSFTYSLALNKLYYITMTRNGTSHTLHIKSDGVDFQQTTNISTVSDSEYELVCRDVFFGSIFSTSAIVYDLKLFNKTLNQAEVTEINTYNRTPITATANLALHLSFNELSGTTVIDKSGNGNNGTLVGYNSGEKPLRDIQNTIIQQYTI